jgi:hypothetical protein
LVGESRLSRCNGWLCPGRQQAFKPINTTGEFGNLRAQLLQLVGLIAVVHRVGADKRLQYAKVSGQAKLTGLEKA